MNALEAPWHVRFVKKANPGRDRVKRQDPSEIRPVVQTEEIAMPADDNQDQTGITSKRSPRSVADTVSRLVETVGARGMKAGS